MNNLKEIRKEKGMTQEELANAVGITQSNLSRIENGKVQISLKLAKDITVTLGCTVDDLIREPEVEDENCHAG